MPEKKWIWQSESYPNFKYNKLELETLLQEIKFKQGILNGVCKMINNADLKNIQLDIFTSDAINTSMIEGEFLNRDSVRSSIAKKLGIKSEKKDSSTRNTDGLTEILIDANLNSDKKLDLERLFGWHNSLFSSGYSGIKKINIAKFRGEEEMQIVSGAIGHEKIHYIAHSRKNLEKEMKAFLNWLNSENENNLIKAGIAHLWFVTIHPFDDGNGRIARAITDMILGKGFSFSEKLYSVSSSINERKKGYYKILEETTSGDIEITEWLKWFLETVLFAIEDSQKNIEFIFQKTKFWDKNKDVKLNQRQKKVLNKILDIGSGEFEGGINTRKYASITNCLKLTASRDLKDLVEKQILKQIEGTKGRNISYEIIL